MHLVISFCFLKLMHRPVDAAPALAPLRGRYGLRLALLVWYSLIIFSVGYLNVLGKVKAAAALAHTHKMRRRRILTYLAAYDEPPDPRGTPSAVPVTYLLLPSICATKVGFMSTIPAIFVT